MKNRLIKLLFITLSTLLSVAASAQSSRTDSREVVRNAIKSWGECRNVVITKTNGDMALYGDNGYRGKYLPQDMNNALRQLNNNQEYIIDAHLTDDGRWAVIYGANGARWNHLPRDLEAALREANNDGETLTSITFNDYGDWILLSEEYVRASDSEIRKWIDDSMEKYGKALTASMTEDALIVVYEDGFRVHGNVPEDLKEYITNESYDIYCVKISGKSWFYANRTGTKFRYKL